MRMRKLKMAAALLSVCILMTGCGNISDEPLTAPGITSESSDSQQNNETSSVTDVPSSEPEETAVTTEAEPDPTTLEHNPLTGEYGFNPDAVGKRSVAVMINNIEDSLPQYGIASADYMYEMVVEGGITRLMAVFADYTDIPTLCSIRSCRYYYPIIAYGLDAVYCHWGQDMSIAKDTLERLQIDTLNGEYDYPTPFDNDETRLEYYDREHTGILIGSEVPDAIAQKGYRTELRDDHKKDYLNFAEGTQVITPEGKPCKDFSIDFSTSYISRFTYDEESKTYLKQHNGDPHMDAAVDKQLAYTNVFVFETEVGLREDEYHMDVALENGHGYYISNGAVQDINWKMTAEDQIMEITDMAGNPVTVNRGKSYFGFTDGVTFE